MQSPLRYALCLAALLLASVSPYSLAQFGDMAPGGEAPAQAGEKEKFGFGKTPGYLIMPIPIANPTIGTGLAATALFNYKHNYDDTESPTSSTGLFGMYTNTDSWMAGAFQRSYLAEDQYRVSAFIGYMSLNLEFFGIGDDSPLANNPIDYNVSGVFTRPRFLTEIFDTQWYLGAQWIYADLSSEIKGGVADVPLPPLETSEKLSALGFVSQYDSRDSIWAAHKGNYFELAYNRYDERWGSDRDYNLVTTFYNHYFTLADPLVLGIRAKGDFSNGDVPYYALPSLDLRGFPSTRYRDNNALSVQGELRWQFKPRWGAVFFGGVGKVYDEWSNFTSANNIPAGGAGIRWLAAKKEGINLALDVAKGAGTDIVWYFRIGEEF